MVSRGRTISKEKPPPLIVIRGLLMMPVTFMNCLVDD